MISLSPRQSRGKIAAALILAPGVRGRRAARAAPSARLRQTRQARNKYHPAKGVFASGNTPGSTPSRVAFKQSVPCVN
jgi:hypothetical protein